MGTSRTELVEQLRKLGVEAVTAEYNGFADSGQIDDPEFGEITAPPGMETAVRDLFYEVLEEHYSGWEIDEGSWGRFEWDVRSDTIGLTHNWMSSETEERTL